MKGNSPGGKNNILATSCVIITLHHHPLWIFLAFVTLAASWHMSQCFARCAQSASGIMRCLRVSNKAQYATIKHTHTHTSQSKEFSPSTEVYCKSPFQRTSPAAKSKMTNSVTRIMNMTCTYKANFVESRTTKWNKIHVWQSKKKKWTATSIDYRHAPNFNFVPNLRR